MRGFSKNRLAVFLLLLAVWPCCSMCTRPAKTTTAVFPKHFFIEIPFQTDNRGIIVPTYWGAVRREYKLYLDNHSPSWVNEAILHNNTAVSKSKDFVYSTTTADGKVLQGDVYMCDRISIGAISFVNIPFYNISKEKNAAADGVIGESIMQHGIWKIDFKNNRLAIASDLDSIPGIAWSNPVQARFTGKAIELEIRFSNNNRQSISLDLGFNGSIILPSADFKLAIAPGRKTALEKRRFSTPAGSGIVDDRSAMDRIHTGRQAFETLISSNELVKEKLIGLRFFKQFEFIVIDYPNKAVYLSKSRNPA